MIIRSETEWYYSIVSAIFKTCRIPAGTDHAQTLCTRLFSPLSPQETGNVATAQVALQMNIVLCSTPHLHKFMSFAQLHNKWILFCVPPSFAQILHKLHNKWILSNWVSPSSTQVNIVPLVGLAQLCFFWPIMLLSQFCPYYAFNQYLLCSNYESKWESFVQK